MARARWEADDDRAGAIALAGRARELLHGEVTGAQTVSAKGIAGIDAWLASRPSRRR